jgi:hypothetical protein
MALPTRVEHLTMSYYMGGEELRIRGGSYTRSFVYLLLVEEVRIQHTGSYTFLHGAYILVYRLETRL